LPRAPRAGGVAVSTPSYSRTTLPMLRPIAKPTNAVPVCHLKPWSSAPVGASRPTIMVLPARPSAMSCRYLPPPRRSPSPDLPRAGVDTAGRVCAGDHLHHEARLMSRSQAPRRAACPAEASWPAQQFEQQRRPPILRQPRAYLPSWPNCRSRRAAAKSGVVTYEDLRVAGPNRSACSSHTGRPTSVEPAWLAPWPRPPKRPPHHVPLGATSR